MWLTGLRAAVAQQWRWQSTAQVTGNKHHTGLSKQRATVILSASSPADKSTPDGSLSLYHTYHTESCTQHSVFVDSAVYWVAYDYRILIHLFESTAV